MKEKDTKHQLSDVRRLASLKQRIREKASQSKQITASLRNLDNASLQSKKIVFNFDAEDKSDLKPTVKEIGNARSNAEKLSLFNSSESEEEEDTNDQQFQIKSQFEGERGWQLFEKSSAITDERFKFDSRFREEDEESFADHPKIDESSSTDDKNNTESEKDKNLSILEKVLGFQVPKRAPDTNTKKRKYVKYDPESENASEYVRKQETEEKTTLDSKKKKGKVSAEPPPEPVVSKERFFEVAPDLKEVLTNSAEPFSFSQKFTFLRDNNEPLSDDDSLPKIQEKEMSYVSDKNNSNFEGKLTESEDQKIRQCEVTSDGTQRQKRNTFFVMPDDHRLTEGVEFFRRTKSMEEARQQWEATRDVVVEMFKRNRRLSLKSKMPARTTHQQKFTRKKFSKR